jgi:hypothetical protein
LRKPVRIAVKAIDDCVYLAVQNVEVHHGLLAERVADYYRTILGSDCPALPIKEIGWATTEGYNTDFQSKY